MLQEITYLSIILLGILNGFILIYFCKDEINAWRKRFFIIAIISGLFAAALFFTPFEYKIPTIVALLFMSVTSITIFLKRNLNKKFYKEIKWKP